jgi:hypothetical protein
VLGQLARERDLSLGHADAEQHRVARRLRDPPDDRRV